VLKLDIVNDVSSATRPLSSLNYIWVTVRFMMVFLEIEDELKRLRNPLWVQAYEADSMMTREKRATLTSLVLAEEDNECMRVMAEAFQNPRAGFMNHVYWGNLDRSEMPESTKEDKDEDEDEPSCTIM
jgi:hypothetical protein